MLANPSAGTWIEGITSSNQYPFGGGDGSSQAQAYEISTPEQLAQLSYNTKNGEYYTNKYFVMINDIDLVGKDWVKIGTDQTAGFNGYFDGNNHKIHNLTISSLHFNKSHGHGLFGSLLSSGVIANLTIESGLISPEETPENNVDFGGIAGYSAGLILNCINKATIAVPFDDVWIRAGGITGSSDYSASVKNSYNQGNISIGNLGFAGGIVGEHLNGTENTTYDNCHNSGDINGTNWIHKFY